jgi:hypothetical protein
MFLLACHNPQAIIGFFPKKNSVTDHNLGKSTKSLVGSNKNGNCSLQEGYSMYFPLPFPNFCRMV